MLKSDQSKELPFRIDPLLFFRLDGDPLARGLRSLLLIVSRDLEAASNIFLCGISSLMLTWLIKYRQDITCSYLEVRVNDETRDEIRDKERNKEETRRPREESKGKRRTGDTTLRKKL